ncbi:MAG: preprotein translocase subunit SecG [Albidovulum sp.]
MENVVLSVHLILALLLIGIVLLQRSEGGGLLGGGGVMTNRGATNALQKVTWALASAFIVTSITLTILAAQNSRNSSVLDDAAGTTAPAGDTGEPALPPLDLAPPPSGDAPVAPPPAQ